MEEKIVTVLNEMSEYLSITQMKNCKRLLLKHLPKMRQQKWI